MATTTTATRKTRVNLLIRNGNTLLQSLTIICLFLRLFRFYFHWNKCFYMNRTTSIRPTKLAEELRSLERRKEYSNREFRCFARKSVWPNQRSGLVQCLSGARFKSQHFSYMQYIIRIKYYRHRYRLC